MTEALILAGIAILGVGGWAISNRSVRAWACFVVLLFAGLVFAALFWGRND